MARRLIECCICCKNKGCTGRRKNAPTNIITPKAIPISKKVIRQPTITMQWAPIVPSSIAPKPNPINDIPDINPYLSGNHLTAVLTAALYPRPAPKPANPPYVAYMPHKECIVDAPINPAAKASAHNTNVTRTPRRAVSIPDSTPPRQNIIMEIENVMDVSAFDQPNSLSKGTRKMDQA